MFTTSHVDSYQLNTENLNWTTSNGKSENLCLKCMRKLTNTNPFCAIKCLCEEGANARRLAENIKASNSELIKKPLSALQKSFCKDARNQYEILQSMFKNMESVYNDLAEYYCFDKQKYVLDEFFSDIKKFRDLFSQAYKDNVKIRETEEKMRRAREVREKNEKERQERAGRKIALVDMNSPKTQEGVMDSLMQALQTGSAFSRDQKQKMRRPRAAGAERRAQLSRSRSRTQMSDVLHDREFSSDPVA